MAEGVAMMRPISSALLSARSTSGCGRSWAKRERQEQVSTSPPSYHCIHLRIFTYTEPVARLTGFEYCVRASFRMRDSCSGCCMSYGYELAMCDMSPTDGEDSYGGNGSIGQGSLDGGWSDGL